MILIYMDKKNKQTITIIYDGDCPVCNTYIRYSRLQSHLSPLLIDARQDADLVSDLENKGYKIDEGMVVIYCSRYYYGAEAMHLLSTLTTRYGVVNRINSLLFSNAVFAAYSYPVLLTGRKWLLFLLGRKPIKPNNLKSSQEN